MINYLKVIHFGGNLLTNKITEINVRSPSTIWKSCHHTMFFYLDYNNIYLS